MASVGVNYSSIKPFFKNSAAVLSILLVVANQADAHHIQHDVGRSDSGAIVFEGVIFDVNSDVPVGFSKEHVEAVKKLFREKGCKSVLLSAYTDSSGPEWYNQGLSYRRALAVKERLARAGLNPISMFIEGAGELNPRATNMTEEGQAKNRRVEVRCSGEGFKFDDGQIVGHEEPGLLR